DDRPDRSPERDARRGSLEGEGARLLRNPCRAGAHGKVGGATAPSRAGSWVGSRARSGTDCGGPGGARTQASRGDRAEYPQRPSDDAPAARLTKIAPPGTGRV